MKWKYILTALSLWLSLAGLAHSQNLLKNGDFEQGGDHEVTHWMQIWPTTVFKKSPKFEHPKLEPHGGIRCASIQCEETGGYSSFTQEMNAPKEGGIVEAEAWLRFKAAEGGSGYASILLILSEPGKPNSETIVRSELVSEFGAWTKVSISAPIKSGTKKLLFRCGTSGKGTAYFDDVVVSVSSEANSGVAVKLGSVRGNYSIQGKEAGASGWIRFSIPFPFEGQTPLGIKVTSEPPNRVERLDLIQEKENRFLQVTVKPGEVDEKILVKAETLLMVRDRATSDGLRVPLPTGGKLPVEILQMMKPGSGLNPDAPEIKKYASTFSRKDLASYFGDLLKFLRTTITAGAGDQGTLAVLERKSAACTGNANVAASLLLASGIPARILACTLDKGGLQEHYIVEAWTPETQWLRIEPSSRKFPIEDYEHFVLRVVYPDSERNAGHAPIFYQFQDGFKGEPWMDEKGQWQYSDTFETAKLSKTELNAIEEAARKNFAGVEQRPVQGSSARFAPKATELGKMGKEGKAFLEKIEKRLGE